MASVAIAGAGSSASRDPAERTRCGALLDLLTPIAKSFPAEAGYDSNALRSRSTAATATRASTCRGVAPRSEAQLDPGTTGIQALDLLAAGARSRRCLVTSAPRSGRAVLHARDYLELFALVVITWQWLELAAFAREAPPRSCRAVPPHATRTSTRPSSRPRSTCRTELPRIAHLAASCESAEDAYARVRL